MLEVLNKGPIAMKRFKKRFAQEGVPFNRSRFWSEREDLACHLFYDNQRWLQRELWWRTPGSILWRCKHLGLLKSWDHRWTGRDVAILRKMYPAASREEICAAIPGVDWWRISAAARRFGFRRDKKPYKITGIVALDQVRTHCYDIKWTMRDLDEECRTRRYFQTRGYRTKYPNFKCINRAVEIFGAHLEVRWPESR